MCLVYFSHFVSDIISSQIRVPPLSAIVSICLTPPPPFVSHCQHLLYPPSPLRQPLTAFCKQPPALFGRQLNWLVARKMFFGNF